MNECFSEKYQGFVYNFNGESFNIEDFLVQFNYAGNHNRIKIGFEQTRNQIFSDLEVNSRTYEQREDSIRRTGFPSDLFRIDLKGHNPADNQHIYLRIMNNGDFSLNSSSSTSDVDLVFQAHGYVLAHEVAKRLMDSEHTTDLVKQGGLEAIANDVDFKLLLKVIPDLVDFLK